MKNILVLLLVAVIFVGAMFGLNTVTGPIIYENEVAAVFAPLYGAMPDAQGFNVVYDAADADSYNLVDVPETVVGIYEETSGLGYALKLSTTQGYTGDAIEFSLAVDNGGIITGTNLTAYPESKDFGADYPATYVGLDGTLTGAELVSGVTYSSAAFKNAVNDAFTALGANELVTVAKKSDDQLLLEQIAGVYPGIANSSNILQYEQLEGDGGAIVTMFKALNGSGLACMVAEGDASYMAVVNLSGDVMVMNTAGEIVTDVLSAETVELVKAAGKANLDYTSGKANQRFEKAANALAGSEDAAAVQLPLTGVFSTVTDAFEVTAGGQTFYGFVACSYAYNNEIMELMYLLDANGAIADVVRINPIIFHEEYFSDYELDKDSYFTGFNGLTADSFTGDQALISGATMSGNGVKSAVADIFAAFNTLKENGGLSA